MNGLLPAEISPLVSLVGVIALGSVFAIISNNVIDRIPRSQSVVTPGPYCKSCAATLMWKDLIPIYSYLRSRGKCPYCKNPIPLRNLVVDLGELAWVAVFILKFGWSYQAFLEMLFGMGLIAVIVIQKESRRLSDLVLLLMGMLTVIYLLAFHSEEFPLAAASCAIGGGILIAYNLLAVVGGARPRPDKSEIKFGAILGLFLGFPEVILSVFIAVFAGATLGSFRIRFMKVQYQSSVPAFPILMAASGLVSILFGQEILGLYETLVVQG